MTTKPKPIPADKIKAVALFAARLAGCNCSPNIRLRHGADGMNHADIAHDEWCEHPSQRRGRDA